MQIVKTTQTMMPGIISNNVEELIGIKNTVYNIAYAKAIKQAAIKYASLVELPVQSSLGTPLFPLDKEMVKNRISHCVNLALADEIPLEPTGESVYQLICGKDVRYNIILNRFEERALIAGIQEAIAAKDEESQNRLNSIAVTFLTGRLRPTYTTIKYLVNARAIQEDIIQEMYLALFELLKNFDLSKTTAGITPKYMNTKLFNAVRDAIHNTREMIVAYETINKLHKFENTPEDHLLPLNEVAKKYHASPALVEIMFSLVRTGSMYMSLDAQSQTINPNTQKSTPESSPKRLYERPGDDYNVSEILMMIDRLPPEQRELLLLKIQGLSHQEIATRLGYKTQRKEEYIYNQAKTALAEALELDPNLYAGLRKLRKKYNKGEKK